MTFLIILFTKLISKLSKTLNLGSGSTWPGHISLKLDKHIIKKILKNSKIEIIFVAGTNGKTTTSSLLKTIFEKDGKKVIQNNSGANLVNGIASALVLNSSAFGKIDADIAIFEVDENTLPHALLEITPNYIVLLNLFRDQLDRYGEIHTIAKKWQAAFVMLPKATTLVLNADDPQIAYLGKNFKGDVLYFGLTDEKVGTKLEQHASDSLYCPNCGHKLNYKPVFFSHLGNYECKSCKFKRPLIDQATSHYPLPGIYNRYNTLAAVLTAKSNNVDQKRIDKALQNFKPAFGRQEIIELDDKKVQIFLSKNPTSFNQSLQTISELGARSILFVLNDRIPDGRDVSWIWDTEIEEHINKFSNIMISGDRAFDMGLRVKYFLPDIPANAGIQKRSPSKPGMTFEIQEELSTAIKNSLEQTPQNETLYILPTYSAMLDVRKILTGRKIL